MRIRHSLATGTAAVLLFLAGCSGIGTVGEASRVADMTSRESSKDMDSAKQPLPPLKVSRVLISDDVWTTGKARRSDHGEPLPRRWERDNSFVLRRATPMKLFEIGTEITNITRIPVTFSPDINGMSEAAKPEAQSSGAAGAGSGGGGGGGGGGKPGGPPQPPDINAILESMKLANAPAAPPVIAGNLSGSDGNVIRPIAATQDAMKVNFEGKLSEFLNQMSSHFNVSWEYSAGEIRIFRFVTRTYTVHALPSSIDLKATLTADSSSQDNSGGSGGGGGGTPSGGSGGSNQKVDSSVNIEIWKDITTAVTAIVGGYGHVSTAVSTGTLTVSAPPPIISRVQSYLDGQNERLNKQVSVSVEVLDLDILDADNYSFDLQGVFQQAENFGFTFGTLGGALNGLSSVITGSGNGPYSGMASNISNTNSGAEFGVISPSSNWRGSNGVIQALSTAGRVTVRTTASVTTLNGVPAPLQVSNTRGYVSNIMVTAFPTIGAGSPTSETQLTTSTITTGFSLSLLPRINADNTGLLLQFGISISDLNGADNGFDNYTTPDGTETVQLPNVNSRNFVQQAFVPNGSTLVLAGFEQNENNATSTGVGSPGFMGLGGSQVGKAQRKVLIILMTPVVLSASSPLITDD
jgi:type IVB pilus formation R64 PilN family outer membrane protein